MKTGIIDVGGGLRGIYAAGVFDWCIEQNIQFDLCIGVSAGSANVAAYMAGQKGRNYQFYAEYAFRKQYMGVGRFLLKKSFIDLDYVYGTLSNSGGENPLDYPALIRNPADILIIATNARTGHARYFDKSDIRQDQYDILKASCAIPFVCKPYEVEGIPYYDGALGDPVPIQKALELGCDRIVLVLTKPLRNLRTSEQDEKFAARIQKKYPEAAKALRLRARRYNESVMRAQELEKEGCVLLIAPDDTCGVDTLTRNKQAMNQLYTKGLKDAEKIANFIR